MKYLFIFLIFISCSKTIDKPILNHYNTTSLDLEMIDLVNNYRASNGLNQLAFNQELCNMANTVTQCSHAYFHDRAVYFEPKYLSECLACGFSTPNGALNGLINSSSHNKILLDKDLLEIGISSNSEFIILEFLK